MPLLSKWMKVVRRYWRAVPLVNRFPDVEVCGQPYIEFPERIHIRGRVYIGPDAYWSAKGGIELGDNVIFAPRTVIWSYNHDYDQGDCLPYGSAACDRLGKVTVHDNVWVGLGAMILAGVTIGEGAVIAAGAVVTRDVESGAVVAGNPARVVKVRNAEHYEELKAGNRLLLQMKAKNGH